MGVALGAALRCSVVLALLVQTRPLWGQVTGIEGGLVDLSTLRNDTAAAAGVSNDGMVIVGTMHSGEPRNHPNNAFIWRAATGFREIGFDQAGGVNADGSVVVGSLLDAGPAGGSRAVRWTPSGTVLLGTLNGGYESAATNVNADGSVVVGRSSDGAEGNLPRAFRWTQETAMVSLGTLNGGNQSVALGVNDDGSVVVGYATDGPAANAPIRAFRWTRETGMASLGALNGGTFSTAAAVNADGSVVVGRTADGAADNASRAFRWTRQTGIVTLGTLNGGNYSAATDVNADGSVVVGNANDGSANNATHAFRWTQASGVQTVEAWLRANHIGVAPDIVAVSAVAVDASGSVVVGSLDNRDVYIARVGSNSGGMITPDFAQSLSTARPQVVALSSAGLIMHGSHGYPLLGRVLPGESCWWVGADAGRDDHGMADGSLELAEFGMCRFFGSGIQLSGSLGRTRSRQNLSFGGDSRLDGEFVTLEAMMQLGHSNMRGTFTGLYNPGETEINRGYLNAGTPDSSHGSADTRTWGVRTRLDWEDVVRPGRWHLTPYGDATYLKTRVDPYYEVEGGFPVSFDLREEDSTELRVGMSGLRPLSRTRVSATLEAVHRFEDKSVHNSGDVLALFAFDVAGSEYEQDWLRMGVGIDWRIGRGSAFVALDATTEGGSPSYWLAASYRFAFQ